MRAFFLIISILLLTISLSVNAQAPQEVPKDHWAYGVINDLASKNYVLGYSDSNFIGDRCLTRYEFASIVKRILDNLNKMDVKTVKKPDMDNVCRLMDEFKVELAVIGTPMNKAESDIADIYERMDDLRDDLTESKKTLQNALSDLEKVKRFFVSGYIKARYNVYQNDPNSATPDPNAFSMRSAYLTVVNRPNDHLLTSIQLEGTQAFAATTAPALFIRDMYIRYGFAGDPRFNTNALMGQTVWPFGYELPQSSSLRETPERSLIVNRLFAGASDRGAQVASSPLANTYWVLGVFNGPGQFSPEENDPKDTVMTVRHHMGRFSLGASGYFGMGFFSGNTPPLVYLPKDKKNRIGGDFEMHWPKVVMKGEYIWGRGVEGSVRNFQDPVAGYWVQVVYDFIPKTEFVVKFETMSSDPVTTVDFGRRSEWNIGFLRTLDANSNFKVFYIINTETMNAFKDNDFVFEWQAKF